MQTVYSTTRPRKYDTKAIAKGKWLQITNGSKASDNSGRIDFSTTTTQYYDTELITVQKIIQKLNG